MKKDQLMNAFKLFRTNIRISALFLVGLVCAGISVVAPVHADEPNLMPFAALQNNQSHAPSDLVSNIPAKEIMMEAMRNERESLTTTVDDQLRTPLALTKGRSEIDVRNPRVVSGSLTTSVVQTLDFTSGTENSSLGLPQNLDPVWAPGDSYIVFASNRTSATDPTPGTQFHLYEIDANDDASSIVQMTFTNANQRWPVFTSASQIVYAEADPLSGVYSLYSASIKQSNGQYIVDETTKAPLTGSTGLDCEKPSSAGTTIAFAARTSVTSPYHIYYLNLSDTSQPPVQVTAGSSNDENVSLSPVDGILAFDSNATGFTLSAGNQLPLVSGSTQAVKNVFVSRLSGLGEEQLTLPPSNPNASSVEPAWGYVSTNLAAPARGLYIYFSSNRTNSHYNIWYFPVTYNAGTGLPTDPVLVDTEDQQNNALTAVLLPTSDPAGVSMLSVGGYDNFEVSLPSFTHSTRALYVSPRILTNNIYDNPVLNGVQSSGFAQPEFDPTNTPTTGSPLPYEVLASDTVDVTPPTIMDYSQSEIIHVDGSVAKTTLTAAVPAGSLTLAVADASSITNGTNLLVDSLANQEALVVQSVSNNVVTLNAATTVAHAVGAGVRPFTNARNATAGQKVHFIVRLSDRETGVGQVYLQIKDPNSKYQQQTSVGGAGIEHKVVMDYRYSDPYYQNLYTDTNLVNPPSYLLTNESSTLTANTGGLYTEFGGPYIADGNFDYTGQNYLLDTGANGNGGQSTAYLKADIPQYGTQITIAYYDFLEPNSFDGYKPDGGQAESGSSLVGDIIDVAGQRCQILGYVVGSWKPFTSATSPEQITVYTTPITVMIKAATMAPYTPITLVENANFVYSLPEIDCEAYIANSQTPLDPGNPTSWQVPPYLPGYDDLLQGDANVISGAAGPNGDLWLPLTPVDIHDPLYDTGGGTLYEGTWTTPTLPTDYYLDVIAFDNAGLGSQNWEIYDNIWGFTTQPFDEPLLKAGKGSILLVNDYMLPQKFFNHSRFGDLGLASNRANNIPVNYFGSESYLTDVNVNFYSNTFQLPNKSSGLSTLPRLGIASLPSVGYQANLEKGALRPTVANWIFHRTDQAFGGGVGYAPHYANGLGVNSYIDSSNSAANIIDEGPAAAGAPAELNNQPMYNPLRGSTDAQSVHYDYANDTKVSDSQEYDIWRILCRGPVPANVLQDYTPHTVTQPVDIIAGATTPKTVLVANSCIIWDSPFAGDEYTLGGTINDGPTQQALATYVGNGGRLYVSGMDVGFALTQSVNGTAFYNNILGAKYESDDSPPLDPGLLMLPSGNSIDYLSRDAYINSQSNTLLAGGFGLNNLVAHTNFKQMTAVDPDLDPNYTYGPPSANDDHLSYTTDEIDPATGYIKAYHSDGSLAAGGLYYPQDQLLQHNYIDTFAPSFTLSPAAFTVPVAGGNEEYTELIGSAADDRLVYTLFPPVTPTSPVTGTVIGGGVTAYSSFGLESLSQDIFPISTALGYWNETGFAVFPTNNNRTDMIHNMVCFLRTGSLTGSVSKTDLTPVSGALVEAAPLNSGAFTNLADPNKSYTFTTLTKTDGTYTIEGVPSGRYQITVYAPGQHAENSSTLVHGGDTAQTVIQVGLAPSVTLTIHAEDTSQKPLSGVNVSAVEALSGNPTYSGVTDQNGNYSVNHVVAGTYNITGISNGVTVSLPNQTVVTDTTVTLIFSPPPGSLTGHVTDSKTGLPISGATVAVAAANGYAGNSVTTDINGLYNIPSIPPGTYSASASANTYGTVTDSVTIVTAAATTQDFALNPPIVITLDGAVVRTDTTPPSLISGATITLTNTTTGAVLPTTSGTPFTALGQSSQFNFSYSGLTSGAYTLTVDAGGYGNKTNIPVTLNSTDQTQFVTVGFSPLSLGGLSLSGLQFFAMPYDYSQSGLTVDQIFGTTGLKLAVWLPDQNSYALTPTPPANTIVPGQGYWARFPATGAAIFTPGIPTDAIHDQIVRIKSGWNMIGNPFDTTSIAPVPLSALLVGDSIPATNIYTWDTAVGSQVHLLSPTIYSYDSTKNIYVGEYDGEISAGNYIIPTYLEPYTGYWVKSYNTGEIIVPASYLVETDGANVFKGGTDNGTFTVNLVRLAPQPVQVTLTSSLPAVLSVPQYADIGTNTFRAAFTGTTKAVTQTTAVTITANVYQNGSSNPPTSTCSITVYVTP